MSAREGDYNIFCIFIQKGAWVTGQCSLPVTLNVLDMGLLYLGTAYSWNEASKYAEHVRQHGVTQFLHIWDRLKDRMGDELLWGDEACTSRNPASNRAQGQSLFSRSSIWLSTLKTKRKMPSFHSASQKFSPNSARQYPIYAPSHSYNRQSLSLVIT